MPLVLASGLAPEDVGSYLKQQLRWASGGFEVLLRGRLFRRGNGLTIDQRLQYLFTGTHYLLSMAMLTFMCLPATYLLFALSPIKADGWTWATHYLPFQAMTLLVTWLQSGGFRLSAIVASIGAAPVHAAGAVGARCATGRRPGRATNQAGRRARSLWAVMPHVALLVAQRHRDHRRPAGDGRPAADLALGRLGQHDRAHSSGRMIVERSVTARNRSFRPPNRCPPQSRCADHTSTRAAMRQVRTTHYDQ